MILLVGCATFKTGLQNDAGNFEICHEYDIGLFDIIKAKLLHDACVRLLVKDGYHVVKFTKENEIKYYLEKNSK